MREPTNQTISARKEGGARMKGKGKWFSRKVARIFGLLAFIATGGGLIIATAVNQQNYYKTEIVIILGALFAISLADHFTALIERDSDED